MYLDPQHCLKVLEKENFVCLQAGSQLSKSWKIDLDPNTFISDPPHCLPLDTVPCTYKSNGTDRHVLRNCIKVIYTIWVSGFCESVL